MQQCVMGLILHMTWQQVSCKSMLHELTFLWLQALICAARGRKVAWRSLRFDAVGHCRSRRLLLFRQRRLADRIRLHWRGQLLPPTSPASCRRIHLQLLWLQQRGWRAVPGKRLICSLCSLRGLRDLNRCGLGCVHCFRCRQLCFQQRCRLPSFHARISILTLEWICTAVRRCRLAFSLWRCSRVFCLRLLARRISSCVV